MYKDDGEDTYSSMDQISWEKFADNLILNCIYSYKNGYSIPSKVTYRDGIIIIRSIKKRKCISLEDVFSCTRCEKTISLNTREYGIISLTTENITTAIAFYRVFNAFISGRIKDRTRDKSVIRKSTIKQKKEKLYKIIIKFVPIKKKKVAIKVHPGGKF